MRLFNIIEKYNQFARGENEEQRHAAILFAFQIPSIFSRLEFPKTNENTGSNQRDPYVLYTSNGKPWDKNLYNKWIVEHAEDFKELFYTSSTIKDIAPLIYEARNNFTHAGILPNCHGTFIFTETDGHNLFLGNTVFISIENFCEIMFCAARHSLMSNPHFNVDLNFEIDNTKYQKLYQEISNFYDDFWRGREDDLKMYQFYSQHFLSYPEKTLEKQRKLGINDEQLNRMKQLHEELKALEPQQKAILSDFGI